MDLSELVKQSAVDATNAYAVANGIEPPILTDKISREAIAAYTSNAGPDANAWVELERMAAKAAAFDKLLMAIKSLEVAANTAEYCYSRPIAQGRFAESMARLQENAAVARAIIAIAEELL